MVKLPVKSRSLTAAPPVRASVYRASLSRATEFAPRSVTVSALV